MYRARLIATFAWRWCLAQLPERFRENCFPCVVHSRLRLSTFLKSMDLTFARQNRHLPLSLNFAYFFAI